MSAKATFDSHNQVGDESLKSCFTYSILEACEIDGNKLIKMLCPWGSSEWKGEWNDNSKQWNEKLLRL